MLRNIPILALIALLTLPLASCQSTQQAIKEAVGEYVTEAVKEHVQKALDQELNNRHLSIAEITSAYHLDSKETKEAFQASFETAKDAALLESIKYIDTKIQQNDTLISQLQAEGQSTTKQEIISYLLGLVAAYLAKWAILRNKDVKENSARDARIQILEKVLNRDIDGDGQIGEGQVVS